MENLTPASVDLVGVRELAFPFVFESLIFVLTDAVSTRASRLGADECVRPYIFRGAFYVVICDRIDFASAAGSAASVMGRPTTMWVAPAAMASAGVTTRT